MVQYFLSKEISFIWKWILQNNLSIPCSFYFIINNTFLKILAFHMQCAIFVSSSRNMPDHSYSRGSEFVSCTISGLKLHCLHVGSERGRIFSPRYPNCISPPVLRSPSHCYLWSHRVMSMIFQSPSFTFLDEICEL